MKVAISKGEGSRIIVDTITKPITLKGYKYVAYLVLFNEITNASFERHIEENSNYNLEVMRFRKISKVPKDLGFFLEAVKRYDKEHKTQTYGEIKYSTYLISDTISDVEDIRQIIDETLTNLHKRKYYCEVKRINKFPFEIPRVINRKVIPLSEERILGLIQARK